MIEGLINEIVTHGDRGAVVPVSHFDELKCELEELKSGAHHSYSDWMSRTMAIPNTLGFEPRSLISVVTPSPKVIHEFNYHGKPVQLIVPPQYSDESLKDNEILQYINAYINPHGYKAEHIYGIPQKLLAVHCGLGLYGRNNICFNEEFGSYIRILSYVSDIPCNEDAWFPTRRMETCEKCRACLTACPTNAIEPNNHIIDARICLTSMNEVRGEFPYWVDTNAHNSLVGCMVCQDCCPGNAHNKNSIAKGATFTEEETTEILGHKADEPYSDLVAAKIKAANLSGFSQVLPRNLAVLLNPEI